MRQAAPATQDEVKPVVEVVNSSLQDGVKLVNQCRSASAATLFFRGETIKAKFRKVTERIAECLRNIPLANLRSTLELQREVGGIVERLNTARCAL